MREAVGPIKSLAGSAGSTAGLAELIANGEVGFRQILDALPTAIYITDAAGRITYFNPACIEFAGRTPELGSDRWCVSWKLHYPDGRPMAHEECPMAIALKTGHAVRGGEAIAERPDGSRVWFMPHPTPLVDAQGKIIGGINMLVDITQPKQAARALRVSEERFRTLFDLGPVGVYTCDAAGVIQEYNRSAAELWGRAPVPGDTDERFCGSFRLIRPDGSVMAHAECPMVDILCGRLPHIQDGEVQIERPDGSRVAVIVNIRPLKNANGEITGAINCFYDITERKRAEERMREAQRVAEAASSAKDRFLAAFSHELRTPLTPVLMAAVAMEDHPGLPPELLGPVAMIRRNAELEAKLIDDLLDLNRITSGKLSLRMEPLDVSMAVRNACETCEPLIAEKRIRLHCDLPAEAILVQADATRLQQVLWNLVRNAAKFTPEGGDIHVSVCKLETGQVRIQVRDTGIGIAAEALPKIFNAFEQGGASITRQFGGMGLGLAISKALVEMHQGSIRAESGGPGAGSSFTVELGTVAAGQDAGAAPRLPPRGTATSLRVLVVDDHADTAQFLSILLRGAGYRVTSAATAAAALELAGKEPFDVLVSDIGLPDATGYELMQAVQRLQPIKGIAMSGYGMDEDLRRSREAGFSDHIIKPVNLAELDSIIRRVISDAA